MWTQITHRPLATSQYLPAFRAPVRVFVKKPTLNARKSPSGRARFPSIAAQSKTAFDPGAYDNHNNFIMEPNYGLEIVKIPSDSYTSQTATVRN